MSRHFPRYLLPTGLALGSRRRVRPDATKRHSIRPRRAELQALYIRPFWPDILLNIFLEETYTVISVLYLPKSYEYFPSF